jgi:predicted DsbA family dithiol-disulfide isomerase
MSRAMGLHTTSHHHNMMKIQRTLGIFSLLTRAANTFPLADTTTTFTTAFQKTSTSTRLMSNSASNNGTGACEDGVCRPGQTQQPADAAQESMLGKDATTTGSAASEATTTTTTTKNGATKIKIEIISDTMCPWCWVGKRNMELALKDHPEINAEIHWLPFFLDRNLPEEGKLVEDYYRDNYGDANAGKNMKPHLIKAGKKVGIDFESKYVKEARLRPTIRSHRLIEYAQRQGKQDEMVEELFRMYYEVAGKHLNSVNDLVESAANVGLSGDVQAYLESSEGEAEVDKAAAKAKRMAQGVPTFLFTRADKPHMTPLSFSGGQPPHMFALAFETLQKDEEE